jgi:hypothetical protein
MNLNKLIVISLLTLMSILTIGCESCVQNIYRVHAEGNQSLRIKLDVNNLKGEYLIFFIDSIIAMKVPDSIKEQLNIPLRDPLSDYGQIVHFTDTPEAWCWVDLNYKPYAIKGFYYPSKSIIIDQPSQIYDSIAQLLAVRFIREVVQPAIKYYRNKSIPDSVVFER